MRINHHKHSAVKPGRPGSELFPDSPLGEQVQGIPTGRDVAWEPLVDYRRNGVSETTIHGAVAWAHGDEVIHSFGGNVLCYGRSMMKPFMLKAFVEELDVPLIQFGRQVRRPRRWYHTCSGEHAAILRGCREKGWNRAGYTLPSHQVFEAYMTQIRRFIGEDWTPQRIAKDGCGLPTVSNTVAELAQIYAGLVRDKNEDWIWEAMVRHPDLVGGFNRLDSTILKAGEGTVIAKEGADGLLGLAIEHPDYPKGLGIVIKIAHGWNAQATWYVARAILGVLGIDLRNPYPLHRQKAFIVPGIVPERYIKELETIPTWDEWDPDQDRWMYDAEMDP